MPLRDFDRQLLDRCLRHEPGSWIEFVDRYMGLIYHVIHHVAYARSVSLSPADVEDICAEILLRIVDDDYGVLRRFKAQSSLPTYLTVVARRICVKELVKRRREASLGHATAHRAALVTEEEDLVEPIASAEEVEAMLRLLPEREARVVRLYHLSFLNYRQIGKELDIPENSVGPILAKARRSLREAAEERAR
ncbi:RNA polymerase sigma factor [Tautonia sociabilis]|uniref:Sigma-70 family RNA polymerase sigma factor n=1 Tax=Tautonia sociabilis TaxID=2080755 RepID=A0A432MGK0_9BACT|nr:sigma-70 family RNA polymerase sigma factor [Tautonia sociabilis]RUL85601.1 sigma-70 family RNA polymerase sigma factor [Tautonia sociabilis]